MTVQSEIKQLRRAAEGRGWLLERCKNNHIRWTYPKNGGFFFSASTPSDIRAFANIESTVKKIEAGTHPNCQRKQYA